MRQPLMRDIPYQDPVKAFRLFAHEPYAQLLHSCPGAAGGGRVSIIALDPFETLVTKNGVTQNKAGDRFQGDPFDILQRSLQRYALPHYADAGPFSAGAIGYLSYEMLHYIETIARAAEDVLRLPDMQLGFYDVAAIYDHETQKAWLVSTGLPEQDHAARQRRAESRADDLCNTLKAASDESSAPRHFAPATSNTPEDAYLDRVRKAVDYIYAGDIYQANLSQRFSTDLPAYAHLYDAFHKLITINPVSYAAYLNFPEVTIASNSPERFIKVERNGSAHHVETRPIKGTRPRGKTQSDDSALQNELMSSEKDRAENIMIVDLLRNDLSRVCKDHSVDVTELCALESYASLHHLVSTITGTLKTRYDAVDLLKACFPGGSITGAPKVRAMEIISELENTTRGPYCGAIGYLGFDGTMDTNITIRTMIAPHTPPHDTRQIFYPVGGGIVADSDPHMEYEESLVKAKAFFDMLADPAAEIRKSPYKS